MKENKELHNNMLMNIGMGYCSLCQERINLAPELPNENIGRCNTDQCRVCASWRPGALYKRYKIRRVS